MERKVNLPKDEQIHKDSAIEWWYFNGFLNGKKNRYAFMTCLFKADKDKVNLNFLKLPLKTIYFSHSILYDLKKKTVKKEVLPVVILSEDSFSKENLLINYVFPIRKKFTNYEISRYEDKMKIKTDYFDLWASQKKKPMLEGGKGYIDLGEKSTYYYSYSNLNVMGYVDNEKVSGKAWHDRQWSNKGFMKDSWLWFSFQMSDNTEIVCFDYKGKKMASILYPNGKQEESEVSFIPIGKAWKSPGSKIEYNLSWEIKIKNFNITTKPIIKNCEMNFGFLNYWEGPLEVKCNGKKALGFMENLAKDETKTLGKLYRLEKNLFESIKNYFK